MLALMCIWAFVLCVDNTLPLLLAKLYPNYSHKEMALSVLGCKQSPVKWIYNVWCIISGITFCIAPLAFYKENGGGLSISVWVLLAIYGVGCEIISGFCPLNEDRQEQRRINQR